MIMKKLFRCLAFLAALVAAPALAPAQQSYNGVFYPIDVGNVASASTVNLCALKGNKATITGTTAITNFGSGCQAGSTYTLRFASTGVVLTNGSNLLVPGAANYTAQAGDVFTYQYAGSSIWFSPNYSLVNGQAIVGSGLVLAGSSGDFQKNNGSGNLGAYTVTQATAALNAFVGDSGSGGTKGLVPAPGAGDNAAGKFLKAGGGWSVPAGGGNVNGPGSSVAHDCAQFADTSGTLLEDPSTGPCGGGGAITPVACGATCTLTGANNGAVILFNRAAGSVATLPAATGSGNTFHFITSVALTSNVYQVNTASGSDTYTGIFVGQNTSSLAIVSFVPSAGNDKLALDGAHQGGAAGVPGEYFTLVDIATNKWMVYATFVFCSNACSTPFST